MLRTLAVATAAAVTVVAQTPLELRFTQVQDTKAMQMMGTVIRSVGEIRDARVDPASRSFTISGAPWQMDMASWLLGRLDRGDGPDRYEIPGQPDPVVRVMRFEGVESDEALQEISTVVRSVVEIRRGFTYNPARSFVMRATADEIAAAEWAAARLLNRPAAPAWTLPGTGEGAMRVFLLRPSLSIREFQDEVIQVRKAARLRRMFTFNATRGVATRGTPAEVAEAERLFRERGVLVEQ